MDFKIFEVSKKEQFIEDIKEFNAKQQLPLYDDYSVNTIINTWKAYDAIELNQNFIELKLHNYTAHYDAADKLYLINANFSHDDLMALASKLDSDKDFRPKTIVIYGQNFSSAMQNEIYHNLSVLSNKKSIELKIIVRYI